MKLNKKEVLKQMNLSEYELTGYIYLSFLEGDLELCTKDLEFKDNYNHLNKEKQEELYQILGFILGK